MPETRPVEPIHGKPPNGRVACAGLPGAAQAKQAEEAVARAAAKAAKGDSPALEDDSNEELDPTLYYQNRCGARPGRSGAASAAGWR